MDILPRIEKLKIVGPCALAIAWNDGTSSVADLSSVVDRFAPFAPLRDADVFASAVIVNWGSGIEWPSVSLDYSARRLSQIATEQAEAREDMTADTFTEWMTGAKLTVPLTADLLGMATRQVINYRTGKAPIPRAVQMVVRQLQKEPGRVNALLPIVRS